MMPSVADRIGSMTTSAEALSRSLAGLTDQDVGAPSLLPGWTRGHVLTHLARNADGLGNLVSWARTGAETPMYPSRERRNADIEAGAGRSADDLVADLAEAEARLTAAMDDLDEDQWQARIRYGSADREGPAYLIPWLRRVELEVHHVDLDLDYTKAHWPEDFVEALLGEVAEDYTDRGTDPGFVLVGNDDEGRWTVGAGGPEISGPPPALLGWLLGRSDGTGLHCDGELPRMEAWR